MNKKLVVGIVVAVVVVAGLAWWLVGRAPSSAAPGNQVEGTSTATSMKSLLASGGSQKCTFANASNGENSSGTVYVASGHMRGDFVAATSDGKTVQSHMITDGTTSWMWTDQTPQGMKMSFSATSSAQAPSQGSAPQGNSTVDPNAQMNYSCSHWTPDQSEFTLPANVTFSDMSQMMTNVGVGTGAGAAAGQKVSGSAAMCAECNQITNAQGKASCLSAMGCAQ